MGVQKTGICPSFVQKENNNYLYVFQYKDHLGNVRLSYADCNNDGVIQPSSEILEENNYYPFGLKHQGYNDISNSCKSEQAEKYQYNGKEFEDSFGLNIYEMDLRQYDPAIGRWTVQDPVIHHEFSPYSAFDNNPAYWADPSGADAISWIDSEGNLLGATFTGSDAMDAFLFLTGQSSADFLETLTMQVYEFDDIDDSGGGGGGNGGGIKAIGGNVDGLILSNLLGYNQTGYFFRKSISGTYYSHDQVLNMMFSEIERLATAKDILNMGTYSSWSQSVIGKTIGTNSPIIKDFIKIGKVKIPITIVLGFFLKYESSLLSKAERSYLHTVNNYLNSESTNGIYFIKMHEAVMLIPFYESISNSIYDAATGRNLGSLEKNYFGLK